MNIFNRIPQILSRSIGTKFFFILLTASVFSSCNESSVVGLDVQPAGDLLVAGWQDTTFLKTTTVKEDSLHTDASIIVSGDALIGSYLDPVFGKASASLYTQVRLPNNNPVFGVNPVCDSVVLSLTYASDIYGKADRKVQRINVYQLTEDLSLARNYYSNNSLAYSSNDLANGYTFKPRPTDSVMVIGEKQKPQLRVPLEQNFGQVILNNQGNPVLVNNTGFTAFCKGLYITSDVTTGTTGDGNIMHFKMADAYTRLTIYYHTNSADSLKYDLNFSSVGRFSKFSHDFSTADPYLQSQLNGTATADTTLFIQSLAGTKVKIEFPYLKSWNDAGKVAINRAELVIKMDTTTMVATNMKDTFAVPTKLVLFGITTANVNYAIPDAYEANETFDGSFNPVTREYHFNIERYIQQVLTGTTANTGLYLVASGGAVNANRVIIGSGTNTGYRRMKLNITYTKLH